MCVISRHTINNLHVSIRSSETSTAPEPMRHARHARHARPMFFLQRLFWTRSPEGDGCHPRALPAGLSAPVSQISNGAWLCGVSRQVFGRNIHKSRVGKHIFAGDALMGRQDVVGIIAFMTYTSSVEARLVRTAVFRHAPMLRWNPALSIWLMTPLTLLFSQNATGSSPRLGVAIKWCSKIAYS